jgi:hypothetical protein
LDCQILETLFFAIELEVVALGGKRRGEEEKGIDEAGPHGTYMFHIRRVLLIRVEGKS